MEIDDSINEEADHTDTVPTVLETQPAEKTPKRGYTVSDARRKTLALARRAKAEKKQIKLASEREDLVQSVRTQILADMMNMQSRHCGSDTTTATVRSKARAPMEVVAQPVDDDAYASATSYTPRREYADYRPPQQSTRDLVNNLMRRQ